MTVHLTINDRPVAAKVGESLLTAAAAAGIEVPTLCFHPDLSIVGSCRLCLVEIEGQTQPAAACATTVTAGLCVRTETPALVELRRQNLELLLADLPPDAAQRATEGTEFGRWCRQYGARRPVWGRSTPRFDADSDPNPFIRVDLNQCILCTRCVRACEEVQGRFVWGVADRGRDSQIVAGAATTMLDARCESCGACAAYCPTGALLDRSVAGGPVESSVRTTCAYCGVGCQFDLNVRDGRVVRVTSTPEAPVNGLSLCVKGRYGSDFIHHADRLTQPLVREELLRDLLSTRPPHAPRGAWRPVSWDVALDLVAARLAALSTSAGDAGVGLLASAKCSNEENYLVQKLARQVLRTHNVDHCARLCHSSTVAGLSMSFGSGAMSNSMDDVAGQARAMLLTGSNVTEQHPVFGAMLRQAVLRRNLQLVVADPRRIDVTEFATLHLQHRPGTDIALFNGLMRIILERGWYDEHFIAGRCEGFEEFRTALEPYDARRTSDVTGVPEEQLLAAAELLATHKPMAAVWAMGITQHTTGVLNVLALANLQMLLGNMGIPGGGVNPLRGQNNVQGACDMGALPNVYPGYQPVASEEVRRQFDEAWRTAPEGMPLAHEPGLTVTEMIDAAGRRDLRALYILGENPAMTDPDVNHVREQLAAAEFVVLQEIFPSETSRYADVLLPGTSFAERSGTFTNTERRVQLFRQAIPPIGEARPDWEIIADLARRILHRQQRSPIGPQAAWEYASPADILREIAAVTPAYAGVSTERLERGERLQWPVTGLEHPGTPILHVGRFTRGRGRFHAVEHLLPHELPDADFPLLLTTGRVLYHWHGGEMTRRSAPLAEVYPQPLVEVSPEDARRLTINDGDRVRVESRRGEVLARAAVTPRVSEGVIFGSFHFPGPGNINNLTIAALDPVAKIPEYKVCAARLRREPE